MLQINLVTYMYLRTCVFTCIPVFSNLENVAQFYSWALVKKIKSHTYSLMLGHIESLQKSTKGFDVGRAAILNRQEDIIGARRDKLH